MRILGPVVIAQSTGVMARAAAQSVERRTVGEEAVGHDFSRRVALFAQQFPQQFQGCAFVAALLSQHVENFTFLVDSPSHEHAAPVNADDHFVEMPD